MGAKQNYNSMKVLKINKGKTDEADSHCIDKCRSCTHVLDQWFLTCGPGTPEGLQSLLWGSINLSK